MKGWLLFMSYLTNYGRSPGFFSNPFTTLSNKWMPKNMNEVFDLCEWMYRNNGTFRAALERIARLFITKYKYESCENTNDLEAIKDVLEDNPKFSISLICAGIEYLLKGNCFLTLYMPFRRTARCNSCGAISNASEIDDFSFNGDLSFEGTCPSCGTHSIMGILDIPTKDLSKINMIRISPKEIEMIHNKVTGNSTYFWNPTDSERRKYLDGKGTILIYETPVEILKMIYKGEKIKFNGDTILHLSQPNLSGSNIEWGMPFALSCFPLVFYIAVLRKANEAISMDYIIPLRIIFPENATSKQEAGIMGTQKFKAQIKAIIEHHKQDPDDWHTVPFPIGYKTMGGEKRSLMISDDIKLSNDELLNSIGFPAELFYGTVALQATPMALRLLENTFSLTQIYNKVIRWYLKQACSYTSMEYAKTSMVPLKWADDIEWRQMMVQLAAAQKVSDIDILDMYGIDYEDTQRKKLKQMQILNKVQTEASKNELLQQQMSSDQQGLPGANTPMSISETARVMAEELYNMPEQQRKSQLDTLLKTQPLLHDAVMGELSRYRNKQRTLGAAMLQQQQQQQGQPLQ